MASPLAIGGKREEGALARFVTLGMVAYICIYCLESPVRYALYLVHASPLILGRDIFVDLPVVVLLLHQAVRGRLHWGFLLFFAMLAIGGPTFIANFGTKGFFPLAFGIKLVITIVLGLAAGRSVILPGKWIYRLFVCLLFISVAALITEKLGGNFPWVGLHDTINGTDIELSRDWSVEDPVLRRVGGFFRLSICAAMGLSVIALAVVCRIRRRALRLVVLLVSFGGVVLTTQKGAIAAFLLVMLAMFLAPRSRLIALRALVVFGAFFNATTPFFTSGMLIIRGHGSVASAASISQRIMLTWPNSWKWVSDHTIFPFGVGIGGMGIPLKSIAPGAWMFPDNMFILMYAYFGVFAVLFYAMFAYGALRSIRMDALAAEASLSILAFLLIYGIVISIVEDQIAELYLGASVGLLFSAPVSAMERDRYRIPRKARTSLAV